MKLDNYKTLVFDCDGVVLNSNQIKTQAFYEAAAPYGKDAAQALVTYHVRNGGISRYEKFKYFLREIINDESGGPDIDDLLRVYAKSVWQGLLTCEVAPGIKALREMTSHANWLIVSGGNQEELHQVFRFRGLDYLFDGGIFGSPDNKDLILSREIASANIKSPGIFIGDSRYDYEAAKRASLDFVFANKWSEVRDLGEWLPIEIPIISGLSDIVG
ncbi:MAG: phosphoglycolate phosphatase-like HAD superfamily hydrolase [Porticoccus sp.]|uniref:HAD family hydrolase n=1 Tax=Porticoccus sp. TaxID=2024853 RepID=UPI0039E594A9